MRQTKKVKSSSKKIYKSEMISGTAPHTHQPGMLSSKKKKKSKKGDTSLQSTLNSYISTSSPEKTIQPMSNTTDVSKKRVSPKKEHLQAPSNEDSSVESSSDESLDNNKKRKNVETTEERTSKKIKLERRNVDTVRNAQSNSLHQNKLHLEDIASRSSDMTNKKQSQEHESDLAPKTGGHSNISSDEGVDSGEEFTAVPKNHFDSHPIEEEEMEENQLEEHQLQPEIDGISDWSKEQTEELIFMIQERIGVVKPEDSMSYRCRLKILPWEDLPSLLHPPRTEQECKDQLQHIVENTKTVRNLSEMLRAYKAKPTQKKIMVMNRLRRFMLDHEEELKKLKGNWIMNAKAGFDALPEEEKQQYTDAYNNEMALKKTLKLKLGRPTFKIFCATLPNASAEKQKEKFLALTPEQKVPFIKQALKEHKQCLKKYEAQYNNSDPKPKPPTNRLTKEEWRLFLESKGMPLLQAVSPFQLYLLERTKADVDMTGDKTKSNALRRYQDFVRSRHYADYDLKFRQELDEFNRNFKAWFANLKSELYKEPAHAYYTEMTTSKGGVKKTKFNFKVTSKVQELEQSYVESTMVGKFCDEPAPTAMTAKDVFKVYAKAKNPKSTAHDLNNTWNHLPKTHREKFMEVATNNVKEYKSKLKHYVKNLSDYERRVYIGQNRVRYIRVFEGTDIFEKNYPCSEYPPFRILGKNEKKSPTKKAEQSKLDIDISSMFKPAPTAKGFDENGGSEEEALSNMENALSEESFKGRLPSTSTPGSVAKKGTVSAKQKIVARDGSDSESGSSESDEDVNGDANNSTQYLDAVKKIHSKKLLKAHSESDSDETSESEQESPKPTHPAKASRSPAPVQATPKQLVASATGGDTSSSEEETSSSSSDENAPVAKMSNSLSKALPHAVTASPHSVRASPHHTLSTKSAQRHLSPKKQAAPSSKMATPSTKLLKQSPKVAAQRQAESSSSESSDSEEEASPKKKVVAKSALSRMKPSQPPPKDDSSSEDDDEEIVSAWG